jgi:predicted anti-sigma-YlaC factor YlaD
MRCEQAGEMMSAWLDGRLASAEVALLEEHRAGCRVCQAEWRRLQALDRVLASAPMASAPTSLRALILARLSRREQARRAIVGGTTLALGTVALVLLALAPIILGLLDAAGIAPALISGGPQTMAQLLALLGTVGRTLLVMAENFALPLAFLSLFSLAIALALNRLWIGAVRRLRAAH